MRARDFYVRVVGTQVWDPITDNVDVEVIFQDGTRFGATFFTLNNIEKLFLKNRDTGECAGGAYLWASNMILVRELTIEIIEMAVQDLLESGEIASALGRLS